MALRRVGRVTISSVERLGFAARFSLAVVVHAPAALRRLRLTLREIYFSGVLSLVIILVSGLFVGMVLALQGYDALTRYGAERVAGGPGRAVAGARTGPGGRGSAVRQPRRAAR